MDDLHSTGAFRFQVLRLLCEPFSEKKTSWTHDLSILYQNVEHKRQNCRHNQSGSEAEVDQWVLTCYIGTMITIYDGIDGKSSEELG